MQGMKRRSAEGKGIFNLVAARGDRLKAAEDAAVGRGTPAPAAPPAPAIKATPEAPIRSNVRAPEKAAVDTERRAKLQQQMQARLAAAKAAGNMALVRQLEDAMGAN